MPIFSIVVFVFAAILLIPAALFLKGETGWFFRFERAAYKDKLEYSKFLGRCTLAMGIAPVVSGIVRLFAPLPLCLVLLIGGMIATLVVISKRAVSYYR